MLVSVVVKFLYVCRRKVNDESVNYGFRYLCNSIDAGDSRRDSYIFAEITADSRRQQRLNKWGTKIRLRSEDARNDYETILLPSQRRIVILSLSIYL